MPRTKPRRSRSEHKVPIGAGVLEQPHRAADASSAPVLRIASLVHDRLDETEGTAALATALARPGAQTWVDLTGASPEEVAAITKVLGLHPLIAEDILEGNQRAKIEVTDELIHIVLFAFSYTDHAERAEIDIVLGKGFLLTVHGPEWEPRSVPALRGGLAPVLARGPDHLLWALVDAVVDGYFPLLDLLGDAIEDVQEHVIANAQPETLERLFALKTELLVIRRAAAPIREIFNQLTNRDLALIDAAEILYFRDVYDHLIRLTDELDNYRELVSGTLDVYLSTVNNQLSLIMKRLTGVTVVLTGIAAIGGIFGMSEAGTALGGKEAPGFWLVTAISISLAFLMAAVLRRIGWI
ncbi:MAG TPA: magnesium transporter CorA family protein [Candidatus Limnocylindrales bacterium]